MKTLHLSIIVGVAISIMVTVPYVILTTPHSTGPIGAVTPDLNAMKSVSTIIIPKDSEDQSSGKNYQPDRFVVILGVNNTVRWINNYEGNNNIFFRTSNDGGSTFGNTTLLRENQTIPEFSFAIPILLISIASLVVFYRMKISK